MKTKVSLVRCASYTTAEVAAAVERAVDTIGGIRSLVRPGERILLKPNLLSAKEPERAITTHPEIVRAVVRLVRKAGAVPVIGDSPGGAIKGVDRVWEKTGMKKVAQEENVELVNFETAGSVEKAIDHPGLKSVHLSRVPLEVDGIINLPKIKTHALMTFTCGIKNFYGCVPGLRKAEYHKLVPHPDDFGLLLTEIYLLVKDKVRFTLADGIIGMEGNGPSSGDLRRMDMIAASTDAVAMDTLLTSLLGFKPQRIEYLSSSRAGENDLSNIEAAGDPASAFALSGFRFPSNWYIKLLPRFLMKMVGALVWMKPEIMPEFCENCLLCVNSCPVKAIRQVEKGKPVVDPKNCINCLCCHELCPYNAIGLKASFLARHLIRQ
jgi:uncharacterized protein (DUF362 family)/NAD-dependent dihydropyrimidine dehydrogenase PreA subunit